MRDSLRQLRAKLDGQVSHTTISRLLREMGYGLKANRKQLTGASHPDREPQFSYIEQQIQRFQRAGWPMREAAMAVAPGCGSSSFRSSSLTLSA